MDTSCTSRIGPDNIIPIKLLLLSPVSFPPSLSPSLPPSLPPSISLPPYPSLHIPPSLPPYPSLPPSLSPSLAPSLPPYPSLPPSPPSLPLSSGLLGAHFAAEALKAKGHPLLQWYDGQLVGMAKTVGDKLLPAFNTSTGIPYSRVRHRTTCTCICELYMYMYMYM